MEEQDSPTPHLVKILANALLTQEAIFGRQIQTSRQ